MINLILLAQDPTPGTEKLFGKGVTGAPLGSGSLSSNFGNLFGFAINIVFLVAALFVLTYMLWGALDFITAGGDSEKLSKARKKIVNAAFGIILLLGTLTIWLVLVRDVLGLVGGKGSNIQFKLPTLKDIQNPDETETDKKDDTTGGGGGSNNEPPIGKNIPPGIPN